MKHAMTVVAFLIGCGSTPTEQCETFVDTFCNKARVCESLPEAQCKEAAGATVPCGKAVGVSASYDECIMDLDSFSCGSIFAGPVPALPANCKNVVQLQQ